MAGGDGDERRGRRSSLLQSKDGLLGLALLLALPHLAATQMANETTSEASIRFLEMDKCVYLGQSITGKPRTMFEWNVTDEHFSGRLSSSAERSGRAGHDGFVGVVYKGDGLAEPDSWPSILGGWPAKDTGCIERLYFNTSGEFMGICELDNTTLSLPNCTYAEEAGLNGTCRDLNATIPIICSCLCDPANGCWGPEPSCSNCEDGCHRCREGFGGHNCKIPVDTDIYEPDGANTLIRITFRRNLNIYGHTYPGPGGTTPIDIWWSYRHASLFNDESTGCASSVEANRAYTNGGSPYTMVNRDTEKMRMNIDLHSDTYTRRPDGSCVEAEGIVQYIGTSPILHHRFPRSSAVLKNDSYITDFMKLGGQLAHIKAPSGGGIDSVQIMADGHSAPEPGDTFASPLGSLPTLTWAAQNKPAGQWGAAAVAAGSGIFTQYFSLVVTSESDQVLSLKYLVRDYARGWMDGALVLSSDPSEPEGVESSTEFFAINEGEHQFIFKTEDDAASASVDMFQVRFDIGDNLNYKLSAKSPDQGALGQGVVTDFLVLDDDLAGYLDTTTLPLDTISYSNASIDALLLDGYRKEFELQPFADEYIDHTDSSAGRLVWTETHKGNGEWATGFLGDMVQYFSLAIYTETEQTIQGIYRNDKSVRGYLDSQLWFSRDELDGNLEQLTQNVTIEPGWHQLFMKLYDDVGDNYFRFKIRSEGEVRWRYSLPIRCDPNPCLNGGTCVNSQCSCPPQFSGTWCHTGFLWGEQYQNRRAIMVLLE